jgi:type I restriction enzyme, S subunit
LIWPQVPLGELCDVLDSRRKPVTKRDRIAGEFPYYGATGILDYVAEYIFNEKLVLIGEDGAKWGSGEKTAFAVEGKYWVNNHAHVIRPNRTRVLDEWIIYYLNLSDLSKFITGLTVPKLNQGKLCEIPIPLPPLLEQHRIVAILDEAFAGLATATANAEKNLKNADELFDSYLNSVFAEKNERGAVARLVGIKGGVVSGVFNLESSGVEAPDWRPRHDKQYHEA